MPTALSQRTAIQAIDSESVYAQPRASSNPVQAWALAGGAILAVQLYVWAKWVTGPYFVRVPAGPSDPPTWMKTILVTWTGVIMLGLPVALYYVVIRPWRRERRITTDAMLMGAFGLAFFQDPLLNYLNSCLTDNTWMFNRGSWVRKVRRWVTWSER